MWPWPGWRRRRRAAPTVFFQTGFCQKPLSSYHQLKGIGFDLVQLKTSMLPTASRLDTGGSMKWISERVSMLNGTPAAVQPHRLALSFPGVISNMSSLILQTQTCTPELIQSLSSSKVASVSVDIVHSGFLSLDHINEKAESLKQIGVKAKDLKHLADDQSALYKSMTTEPSATTQSPKLLRIDAGSNWKISDLLRAHRSR